MKPSEYLKNFIERSSNGNQKEFARLLETHFIRQAAFDYMLNGEFEKFIEERQKDILSKIAELIDFKGPKVGLTEITPANISRMRWPSGTS